MFIVIPMTSEIEPSLIRVWGKDNENSPNFVEELGEFLEEVKSYFPFFQKRRKIMFFVGVTLNSTILFYSHILM